MNQLINKYTGEERFFSNILVKGSEDCWNWTAHTCGGYGRLRIEGKMVLAHRYSWSLVNGPIPEGMMILHKCDNTLCCNPAHLYCGTNTDNMRDSWKRNRQPDRVPEVYGIAKTKLYEGEIWLIRKLWREGRSHLSQRVIAKMFKVDQSTISLIVNSTSWLCREGKYV
jgi:hypothetical protein